MGRDIVLKKLKKGSRALIIIGVLLELFSLPMLIMMIGEDTAAVVTFIVMMIVGGIMIYIGISHINHPERTSAMKKDPLLLYKADELFSDLKYEDKFIYMSSRLVANKGNIAEIAFYDEIFQIHLFRQTTNFITTSKMLVLSTPKRQLNINVYGKKDDEINALASRIAQNCPNARVGYTAENNQYLANIRSRFRHLPDPHAVDYQQPPQQQVYQQPQSYNGFQ